MAIDESGQRSHHDVFISYARDPDYRLARELTRFLESFHRTRMPSAGLPDQPPRLRPLKVCLDGVTFSLPAGGKGSREVSEVIERYLGESAELLLLCSENTRLSPWVLQELHWWLTHRGGETVRLAITEGAHPWQDPEAFFPALVVEHGLHRQIFYDLRGFRKKRAATWDRVSDFDSERVRLAADLNGQSAADVLPLWQRAQLRQARRRQRIALGVVTAVTLSISAAVFFAIDRARARQHAIEQEASRLISEAYEVLQRRPATALLKAHDADMLHATERSEKALRDAYRVLTLQSENRRESTQITGRGPGYLAGCWRESDLYTVSSEDGRYTLLITERGESGASPPGEVYLFDNETRRSRKLEPPDGPDYRVEYAGFDATGQRVLVSRYFVLNIHELDGSFADGYDFFRFTKSPVHYAGGPIADRYLLGADCKGGLWMVDPAGTETHELQREWHGDPLIDARLHDSGDYATLVFGSGRATLLYYRHETDRPGQVEILSEGALFADFIGTDSDVIVITAGREGLLRTWRVNGESVEPLKTYTHPEVDIDWVRLSDDRTRLLTVARDHSVRLLDWSDGTLLKTVDYSAGIDWAAIKALPHHVEPPADARRIRAGGREWLATSAGAFLVEDGRLIRMTESFHNVRDIVHAAGITWILTGKQRLMGEPGTTYRVSGYLTVPIPEQIGQVNRVLEYRDRAYLSTDTGVYRLDGNDYQRIGGIDRAVHDLRTLGETLWAVTTHGLGFGPVYRIEGLEATPFPDEKTPVQALFEVVDTVWIHVGDLLQDGPVYRIEGDAAVPILDRDTAVRQVSVVRDGAWLLADQGAFRIAGDDVDQYPAGNHAPRDIVIANGVVWLLTGELWQPGPAFRIEDDRAVLFRNGDVNVVSVKETDGKTVITVEREPFIYETIEIGE